MTACSTGVRIGEAIDFEVKDIVPFGRRDWGAGPILWRGATWRDPT